VLFYFTSHISGFFIKNIKNDFSKKKKKNKKKLKKKKKRNKKKKKKNYKDFE